MTDQTNAETTRATDETRINSLSEEDIARLAEDLTDEEREVLLHQGTERPFCGNLLDNKRDGRYACRLCGLELFSSHEKFHSGTGWPSFFAPIAANLIQELPDHSHGRQRVEIRCVRCGGHLGHVFEDGPKPTGLRYCLNSVSMTFVDEGQTAPDRLARLNS